MADSISEAMHTDSLCSDIASGRLTIEKLVYWINCGYSLEGKNKYGLTPLGFAAQGGYIAAVRFLLAKGANSNSVSSHNRSALWFAAKLCAGTGGFPIISNLLDYGADPNIQADDALGHTPLMNAVVFCGDVDVIKLLLKAGASKDAKRKDGLGLYDLAKTTGNPEIIKLFGEEPEPLPPVIDPSATARTLEYLQNFIIYENPALKHFYKGDLKTTLAAAAQRGAALAEFLMKIEACPQKEVATQAGILALYDLVILLDDSMSMQTEEEGKRIPTLESCLRLIAKIYSIAAEPETGILGIRFLNSTLAKDKVSEAAANKLVENHHYGALTRIGSALKKKILPTFVYNKEMEKPLLIMVISDGEVEGERQELLPEVLVESITKVKNGTAGKGEASIAYQFSRVGNNEGAKALLQRLDDQENIADHVDTQAVGIDLETAVGRGERTAVLMLVKTLLGAISVTWDDLDPLE